MDEDMMFLESGELIEIFWAFTKNEGEEYDDEERFCGHKTTTTLNSVVLPYTEVWKAIEHINDTSADYGDGVTQAKVLCVVNNTTREILPKDADYWKNGDDD